MAPLYPNKQKAIVGEFYLMESRITNRSKKAFKKIQGWKACNRSTEAEPVYLLQFNELIHQSFFNLVSNSYIIKEEDFLNQPHYN